MQSSHGAGEESKRPQNANLRSKVEIIGTLPSGETFTMQADPAEKISSLKSKIEERYQIPCRDMALILATDSLDDERTVADYDFQDSDLRLVARGKGGGPAFRFTFNALNEVKKVPFSRDAPDYRGVSYGLSFRSICRNPQCRANGDSVYVTKGFGEFDVCRVSRTLLCPACNKKLEPSTNCGFYMTKWKFEGVLADGTERKGPETRADTDVYHTFEEGDNAVWQYIFITTTPL